MYALIIALKHPLTCFNYSFGKWVRNDTNFAGIFFFLVLLKLSISPNALYTRSPLTKCVSTSLCIALALRPEHAVHTAKAARSVRSAPFDVESHPLPSAQFLFLFREFLLLLWYFKIVRTASDLDRLCTSFFPWVYLSCFQFLLHFLSYPTSHCLAVD